MGKRSLDGHDVDETMHANIVGAMIYRSSPGKYNFLMFISQACGTDLEFCSLKECLHTSIPNGSNFLPNHNKSIINENFSV
jgi:hypothetical protein